MPRVPSADRRAQLVAAGRRVLLRDGRSQLTVRRVAAEAGASVASVHYAFRDMDELVDAVAEGLLAGFRAALADGVRADAGLSAAVEDVLAGYRAWVTGEPGLARAVLDIALTRPASDDEPGPVALGERTVVESLRPAAPSVAEADLADLAQLLLVAIDGLTLVQHLDPSVRAERRWRGMAEALGAYARRMDTPHGEVPGENQGRSGGHRPRG